jgi:hypothetical protein
MSAPSPCKALEWLAQDLVEWAAQLPLDSYHERVYRCIYRLAEDIFSDALDCHKGAS